MGVGTGDKKSESSDNIDIELEGFKTKRPSHSLEFEASNTLVDEEANTKCRKYHRMDADDEEMNSGVFPAVTRFLFRWGVEVHGITPTAPHKRTDRRITQLFWIWFSANFNILALGTGSAGPAFFGLGLKSSLVILLLVDLITCAIPAYFAVFGPKLGTRGMVQCRYSWGFYFAIIPSILNVVSMEGFLILNCIIGGQALSAVSNKLDDTLGIIIIGMVSLVVTFCGYRLIHWFEGFAWIPNAIAFPVLLGMAKKHLDPSTFPSVTGTTPAMVLSFASFVASSVISWCTLTPDYGVYHDNMASTLSIFLYVYFGFLIPSIAWHMLGAALAAAAPGVPTWRIGFEDGNNVGGLLNAILKPSGDFGKVLLVLISLSASCACAPTMYTFGTSFMSIAPFFARFPRYIFSVVSAAILVPLAIVGAEAFYNTLVNVLSIIGYWSTAFAAIVLTEHFLFRRASFSAYDISHWNQAHLLPPGFAAIFSFVGAFGIIVPSMKQSWYTGPIAKAGSGDIGVFTGAIVAVGLYSASRTLERELWPGR